MPIAYRYNTKAHLRASCDEEEHKDLKTGWITLDLRLQRHGR